MRPRINPGVVLLLFTVLLAAPTTEVSFPKRSRRLRDGRQSEVVTWDASELRTIARDAAVIGRGNVKVKGKIGANDLLHCELGTAEITGN